ncbi:transcriptional regulator, TetR family [Chitinophaga sp. YR573]|uniref:TetR/AcrR family transcriptional regulator n=1 Tax=Chitinophaga sp. YR573 TaxID=1881040 RepID=UPI0008AE4410|nr:TetR/AcrR family transcriptional regulator [Chitinophaga sp. YR573]SEW05336.1 transcriptional regulator, TetR family [Chitinophaga sp. YR573]
MKDKKVHEQRMKGYFLQATKEILKAEGLKSLSVRNIAEKAGYSYTTMYSYFQDINDLIFLCVHDFYEECNVYVKERTPKREKTITHLKSCVRAYMDFFIQYPGIFDLFFLEKMEDFGNKKAIVDIISSSLNQICEEAWNDCLARNLIKADQIEILKGQVKAIVFGSLLLYLNRRTPSSYTEFINQFNPQLDRIFETGTTISTETNTTVNNSLISIKL